MKKDILYKQLGPRKISFQLDSNIYNKEILLLTVYNFLDIAYCNIKLNSQKHKFIIFLELKANSKIKNLSSLKREFLNELIYSALRYNISQENKTLREFIIGTALLGSLNQLRPSDKFFNELESLSSTMTDSEKYMHVEENDNQDKNSDMIFEDPLGIAIPWEEKYGKKQKTKIHKISK